MTQQMVSVSTPETVLEQFRADLVAQLEADFVVPPEAKSRGNCHAAVVAWQRLRHRAVPAIPRRVLASPEVLARDLGPHLRAGLAEVQAEIERGDDMAPRLTRKFYKTGFNDFLFNNFAIQHMHLGPRGADLDKTKRHRMAGGGKLVVFALVSPSEAYLLDVLSHDAFDDVKMAKELIRIALRDRRNLLARYIMPADCEATMPFESAFTLAKGGFGTAFKLDGVSFMTGSTVMDGRVEDGKRDACTSIWVVDAANRIVGLVRKAVDLLQKEAEHLAENVAVFAGSRPTSFTPVVVYASTGEVELLDEATGVTFGSDGRSFWSFNVRDLRQPT